MSRRFGRNQRRRMREAIAEADRQQASQRLAYRALEAAGRQEREVLAYVTEALRRANPDTTMLPPKRVHMQNPAAYRRVLVQERVPSFIEYTADTMLDPLAASVEDLVHVAAKVEYDDSQEGRHHVHLFLEGRESGDWRYAISQRAIDQHGIHPGVLRDIAQRIACDVVRSFERSLQGLRK